MIPLSCTSSFPAKADLVDNLPDQGLRREADVERQHALIRSRRLQGGELAAQEVDGHEVSGPRAHPPGDQRFVALKMDEDDLGAGGAETVAIDAFEGGAGEHGDNAIPGPGADGL